MAQIKCKKGHHYNNEIYNECPYCKENLPAFEGTSLETIPSQSHHKELVIKILAVISVIIAGTSFFFANFQRQELAKLKQDILENKPILDEMEKEVKIDGSKRNNEKKILETFKSAFGQGSKEFYAELPVVVLEAGGSSKWLEINGNSKSVFIVMDYIVEENFKSGWSTDIQAEWTGNSVKITPGKDRGYNLIHFYNKENNDTFDVLVVVK